MRAYEIEPELVRNEEVSGSIPLSSTKVRQSLSQKIWGQ